MKKILYIVTIPDWGGAQHYIFNLSYNLKDEFAITVASGKLAGISKYNLLKKIEEYMPNNEVGTHEFKNLTRSINPIRDILAIFDLVNYINSAKPDIIHLNSSKAGIIGSIAARLAKHKAKVVYTIHGWVFLEPMNKFKRWLYIRLEKFASRFRNKIIILGLKEKQIALNYKICHEEKIKVLPHGIIKFNRTSKERAREKLGLPQNKKIIGTISNLYTSKGIEYLIEAAANIKDDNIIFVVIGDGELKNELNSKIQKLNLQNRFNLLGEVFYAAQYLNAFDIFTLSSIKEGMPFVILEAMEAGLPIVATDVGNIQEMMEDYQNKIIVPSRNSLKLAQAIQEIRTVAQIWNPKYDFYFNVQMSNLYNSL